MESKRIVLIRPHWTIDCSLIFFLLQGIVLALRNLEFWTWLSWASSLSLLVVVLLSLRALRTARQSIDAFGALFGADGGKVDSVVLGIGECGFPLSVRTIRKSR